MLVSIHEEIVKPLGGTVDEVLQYFFDSLLGLAPRRLKDSK